MDFSKVNILTFLVVYFAGVLASFTPCIYPLVPVTVGFIGARSAGSRSHGFVLSLAYVLGLSLLYSVIGMVSALTGKFYGAINSHPATLIVMGNLYILFALGMFGVFNWQFSLGSESIKRSLIQKEKSGIATSFLLGAVSALVTGPCTLPVLGALLTWISKEHHLWLGGSLMFVFSLGLGTLLILCGTFAGILAHLPRSGRWLNAVKIIFGLILLGGGEYFLIQAGKALF